MPISNGLLQFAAAAVERPLFSMDTQTFISVGIQLFNACLLAVALRHFLYKPVRKFMQKRTEGIKDQMNSAEETKAKANELIELYEKKLEDLETEKAEALDIAKEQAAALSKEMIDTAKKEIAAIRVHANDLIRKERERADEDMKQYIIEIASYMAGKFVALSMDEESQNKIFEESLSELETVLWQRRTE